MLPLPYGFRCTFSESSFTRDSIDSESLSSFLDSFKLYGNLNLWGLVNAFQALTGIKENGYQKIADCVKSAGKKARLVFQVVTKS
jgi:hypothetical protein